MIHHGEVLRETAGTNLMFVPKEPGAYRLEAWLAVDGEDRPWIYSNPVFLRVPSLSDLRLPSRELSSNVEVKPDLDYAEGQPADANKHRLDLYLPKDKSGTIALSGVFDLAEGDSQASVFGKDKQIRRDASPLFRVQSLAPPFLISYCQWDYPTLPAQARVFHAALQKAGVAAQLLFVPRESHISEMISITHDDDPTARAILRFVGSTTSDAAGGLR